MIEGGHDFAMDEMKSFSFKREAITFCELYPDWELEILQADQMIRPRVNLNLERLLRMLRSKKGVW